MAKIEQSDVNIARLLQFGTGVLLLVLLSMLAMGSLQGHWRQLPGPLTPPPGTPVPGYDVVPFTQPDPKELHNYGWVDRPAGLVKIPIEEAMQVVSQGGSRAADSHFGVPTDGSGGRAEPPQLRPASGSPTPRPVEVDR